MSSLKTWKHTLAYSKSAKFWIWYHHCHFFLPCEVDGFRYGFLIGCGCKGMVWISRRYIIINAPFSANTDHSGVGVIFSNLEYPELCRLLFNQGFH